MSPSSATLFTVLGILYLLGAVIVGAIMIGGDYTALLVAVVVGTVPFVGVPHLIGGWGVLKYKSWGRGLVLILALFSLVLIPIGTIIGAYGLWVLLSSKTEKLFETGGVA